EPAHSPSVFPLYECGDCEGQVTFGCFASGFFPRPADITWVGVASGSTQNFPEVQTGAGSFGVSSQVTLSAELANGNAFTCRVGHQGKNFETEVEGERHLGSAILDRPS
uniref:Ig-like domain-containing protein n=1 Tax=Junco hyemalis TaxID=40217 RepID=A0A8C5J6X5_JUNHY